MALQRLFFKVVEIAIIFQGRGDSTGLVCIELESI